MIRFLLLFSLITSQALAVTYVPPEVGTMVAGVATLPATSNLVLVATTATSTRWGSFATANGTSGYRVTTGKVMTCVAIVVSSISGVGSSSEILYGNNDVGTDGSSAPAQAVYSYRTGGGAYQFGSSTTGPTTYYIYYTVPPDKIMAIHTAGAGQGVTAYCSEN